MTTGKGYAPLGKSKTIPTPDANRIKIAKMRPKGGQ